MMNPHSDSLSSKRRKSTSGKSSPVFLVFLTTTPWDVNLYNVLKISAVLLFLVIWNQTQIVISNNINEKWG